MNRRSNEPLTSKYDAKGRACLSRAGWPKRGVGSPIVAGGAWDTMSNTVRYMVYVAVGVHVAM